MRRGGERLMIGFPGTTAGPELKEVLERTGARSVILFAKNIVDAAQCRDLIAEIRGLVPWPLLVAVDQEGGAVVRIARGATVFPAAMAIGAADDPALAHAAGRESARQLRSIGFDMNLAPVVDLQTNPGNPGIGIRSFGADPERALPLIAGWIRGHREFGVGTCLKHFPGKGAASVDAHIDLPFLDQPLEEFRRPHLQVFERLFADGLADSVMTTHLVLRALDAERPATFSRAVATDLLRRRMGFGGLLIADDLEMGAITKHGGVGAAAVRAAEAGHDLLPICHAAERQIDAAERLDLALKDGRLDPAENEAAVRRIESFAARSAGGSAFDRSAGDAVAETIARRAVHLFGDRRGLLPIGRSSRMALLLVEPHAIVGVEEEAERDWAGLWRRVLDARGFGSAEIFEFKVSIDPASAGELVQRAEPFDVVLLTVWNARGSEGMRTITELAVRSLASKLVVLHLRTPFDQAFIGDDITSLTPFGYRIAQIEALVDVLAGREKARGTMPAPVR